MSRDRAEEALARFRPWLAAAAIYNLLWGSINIVFPDALFRFLLCWLLGTSVQKIGTLHLMERASLPIM